MKVSMRTFVLGALALTGATVALGCGDDTVGSGGAGGEAVSATTGSQTTSPASTSGTASTATSSAGSAGDGGSGGGNGGSSGDGGSSTASGGSGQGGDGDGGNGDGGSRPAEMEVVAVFDPDAFELPEGLALRGDEAIVGFALTGAIESVSAVDGARESFASVPPPPPNTSFLTGLSLAPDGDLVAALVSFTDDAVPGLYRVGPGGGAAELWATHPDLIFPNGMAWDQSGLLYFTDSLAGGVFTADDEGVVTPWATDELLGGDPTICGGSADDIAVGANGIVWADDVVYVAGSDYGVIIRFPVEGSAAGAAEIVAGPDCDALAGIDGLAMGDDGTLVGAVNRADRIVRIDPVSGDVTTIAEGAPLDFPASLEIEDDGSILVTSFALDGILTGGEAAPALVRVIPGE